MKAKEVRQAWRFVIAENIKRVRAEKGLSQSELAEKCKLHQHLISLVEHGHREIRDVTLDRIAAGLGVTVNELMPVPAAKKS